MAEDEGNPLQGLDDDQVAKIMHLQELTGDEDLLACRQRLERCEWNIQVAVNQSLFGADAVGYANEAWTASSSTRTTSNAVAGSDDDDDIQELVDDNFSAPPPLSATSGGGGSEMRHRRPAPADSMPFLATTVRNRHSDSESTSSPSPTPPFASFSADTMPPPHAGAAPRRDDLADEQLRGAILRQINRMERHRELVSGSAVVAPNRNRGVDAMMNAVDALSRPLPTPQHRNAAGGAVGGGNFLWNWISGIVDYCYQWALVMLTAVWRFVRTLALPGADGPANYLAGHRIAGGGDGGIVPAANVLAEVEEFIRDFDAKYGATTHPTFYRGGFNQASRECLRQAKFLLVYLHAPNASLTDRFCSQVLCNTSVRDVINNAGNMIFWGSSIASRNGEGYRTMRKLRAVTTFPSLCFLTPANQSMRLSAVIEGDTLMTVSRLIDKIYECVASNAAHLEEINNERRAHVANRAIRAEQDAQYLESLHADQEKEREKERLLAEQRQSELKTEQRRKARAARKQAFEQRKRDALERLPAEPASGAEQTRINLKFPSGNRVERRFSPADDIQCVYYFALAQKETTEKFTVLTNFPRKPVACSPPDDPHLSLKEMDFKKAEALFVETEEDEGSSDSDNNEVGETNAGHAAAAAAALSSSRSAVTKSAVVAAARDEPERRVSANSAGDNAQRLNGGDERSGAA